MARRAVLACWRGSGPEGSDLPPRLIAAAYLGRRREPTEPLASCVIPWLELGARPVDVRELDEFELGHVAGAVHIPLGALAERAAELPTGRPLLTYCALGFRSVTAASVLERLRIGPVVNLRGGYGAWRQAGRD